MGCPSCASLEEKLVRLQADYDTEVSRRTRGSTPPPVDTNWANADLRDNPPPSANDPNAPPLWSSRGSQHRRHT